MDVTDSDCTKAQQGFSPWRYTYRRAVILTFEEVGSVVCPHPRKYRSYTESLLTRRLINHLFVFPYVFIHCVMCALVMLLIKATYLLTYLPLRVVRSLSYVSATVML